MRIALDAMGGDHAPEETVHGAIQAVVADDDLEVTLVGRTDVLEPLLDAHAGADVRNRLPIHHADEVITNEDSPVSALRAKKDNSIRAGLLLVKEGEGSAFVSAGNTGAVVAAASFALRSLPGIRRPAIAAVLPTGTGTAVLIDAGANLNPRPEDLVQYAIMGRIYSTSILGVTEPKVGVLNIGSEKGKGRPLVKEALDRLEASDFPTVGFIEGQDFWFHAADVVVCEAFVGNSILKASEGFGLGLFQYVTRLLEEQFPEPEHESRIGAVRDRLGKLIDYAEYGGAPLLGAEGTCIICHGRSERKAIRNALKVAATCARKDLNDHILKELASL